MDTLVYRQESARGIGAALASVDGAQIDAVINAIRDAPRTFFTGAGRSLLMLKATAMAMMQIGLPVFVTGEIVTPSIKNGDLLIAASCSGETKSVQLFLEQAKAVGATIIIITGNPDSAMGRLADIVLTMDFRSEPGSIQTSWVVDNRFEQAIVPLGDCFVEFLARGRGASDKTIFGNHANME